MVTRRILGRGGRLGRRRNSRCRACLFTVALAAGWVAPQALAQCQFAETWTQRDESSGFTKSIAIGSDFVAIAAPRDSTTNATNVSGSVYLFVGEPGLPWTWTPSQLLAPIDVRNGEEFGWSMATDGDLLVVGARKADALIGQSDTGFGYIFQRDADGLWAQVDLAVAFSPQSQEKLGESVDVFGDTIVLGGTEYDVVGRSNVGRAVVFERSTSNPDDWVQSASLSPATLTAEAKFGASVALAGNTLVVGAPYSNELPQLAGTAFVYERDQNNPNSWNQLARLGPSELNSNAQFGWSVDTNDELIVVGARRYTSVAPTAGRVYIYRRDQVTGQWLFNEPVAINPPAGTTNHAWFGASVRLAGDYLVVGAPTDNLQTTTDPRGIVFIYARSGLTTWNLVTSLRQSLPGADSDFGQTLDFRDGLLVAGDPNWNIDAGAPPLGQGRSYWFLFQPGAPDCDADGLSDACEIAMSGSVDCDLDATPDDCVPTLPIAVWTADYKGIFSDPDSWCDQLPSPLHNVIFRNEAPDDGPIEVVPISAHTVRGLEVRRGWPSLFGNLGAISVRAPGTLFGGYPLRVGTQAEHARLDVIGAILTVGDDALLGSAVLAPAAGSSAEMLISGPSALFDVSQGVVIGASGPGLLTIAEGATVRAAEVGVGSRLVADGGGTLRLPNPASISTPAPRIEVEVQTRVERGAIEAASRAVLNFGGGGLIIERDGAMRTDAPIAGNVVNVGSLSALTSPSSIVINGSYSQVQSGGALTRIGRLLLNLANGASTDVLQVNGVAAFNGALGIEAGPNFNPADGQRFNIINAGSGFTGRFSVASFPGLQGYRFLRLEYNSTTGVVSLVVDTLGLDQDSNFGFSQGYAVTQPLRDAALGRFTVDGANDFPDLAAIATGATDVDPGTLYLFRNTGQVGPNGEIFTGDVVAIPVPPRPLAVATGNFDHDAGARDDAAVLHEDGSVTVIHNINMAAQPVTFFTRALPSMMPNPRDIVAADFDLGGQSLGADIAVAGSTVAGVGQVAVRLNIGGVGANWQGFGSSPTFATGPGSLFFADAGDLDNDKDLDLCVLRDGSTLAGLLFNQRGGTGGAWNGFAPSVDLDLGVVPVAADAGDLDNDKDLDLFVSGRSGDEGSFAVLLNAGNAAFSAPAVLPLGGQPGRLVLAALDVDEDLDAAVIVDDPSLGPVIRVFRNDFDGAQLAFTRSEDQSPDATPRLLLAGDMDLSGTDDVIIINDTSSPGGLPPPRRTLDDVTYLPSFVADPPNDCPADLNEDDQLNFFDVQIFLNSYVTQSPLADWNRDGFWNFFDLVLYLNDYSAGCD